MINTLDLRVGNLVPDGIQSIITYIPSNVISSAYLLTVSHKKGDSPPVKDHDLALVGMAVSQRYFT